MALELKGWRERLAAGDHGLKLRIAHAADLGERAIASEGARRLELGQADRLIISKPAWDANSEKAIKGHPRPAPGPDPLSEALAVGNQPFRSAEAGVARQQNDEVAKQILGNADLVNNLKSFGTLDNATQISTLNQVVDIQGQVLNASARSAGADGTYKAPKFQVNDGPAPQPGVMGFFDPQSYSIQVFPSEWKNQGTWAPFITVTHEARHSFQDYLEKQDSAGAFSSPAAADHHTLSQGFAKAEGVNEQGLSYGDYAHLTVENDAFDWGNRLAAVVSSALTPSAPSDSRYLGEVDHQFNGDGSEKAFQLQAGGTSTVSQLEKTIPEAQLSPTVEGAENLFIQNNPPPQAAKPVPAAGGGGRRQFMDWFRRILD